MLSSPPQAVEQEMVTLILAEDHVIVRKGIKLMLERESDFRLLGEASDGLEAVQITEKLKPDVLLLDLMLPRLHGLEVIRQVRRDSPKTKVIILSMHSEEPYVMESLRYGASGYLLKDCTPDELVKAIREVLAGRRYLSPALAERALAGYVTHPGETEEDVYTTLTKRERLVLQMAAEGLTTSEIAKKLFISPRTVETHRANLMRKLNLHTQTDLVKFAIRKNIISA